MATIEFKSRRVVSLFNNEIVPQISDGMYENWSGANRRWEQYAICGDENKTDTNLGHFNYNLDRMYRELCIECNLTTRMFLYIVVADEYCKLLAEDKTKAYHFIQGAESFLFDIKHQYTDDHIAQFADSDEKLFIDQYGSVANARQAIRADKYREDDASFIERCKVIKQVLKTMKQAIRQIEQNYQTK